MISKLEESSQMRIKSVKEATSILDLKVNNFGFQNHLHYLAQVGLINKGIYFISDDQVVELNSDFNQKITEIEELKSFINNFEIRGDKIEPETKQKLAGFDEFRDRINILEAEKESITEKFEKIEKNLNQKEKDFEELCYKHKDIDFIRKVLIDLEAEAKRIEEEERIYKEKRMDQEIKKVLKGTIKKFIIKCYCKIR